MYLPVSLSNLAPTKSKVLSSLSLIARHARTTSVSSFKTFSKVSLGIKKDFTLVLGSSMVVRS
jgi:hypothetical protein